MITTPPCSRRRNLLATLSLALLAVWPAAAQPSIPVSALVIQGFTNGPLTGYSLNVTGIRGVLFARLDDIRQVSPGVVRAHGGIVQLYGLPYQISSASVNTGTGILSLGGVMSLPAPFSSVPGVPAVQPALLVNGSGVVSFDGGTLTLPTPPYTFPFGPLTIENVSLTIDGARDIFGGGAHVGIGGGPTVAFCVPQGSTRIIGAFEVANGQLNLLTVGASNLKKPLGTSGAYLDSVTATIGNLAVNNGRNWFLSGSASVMGGGCPIANKWPWRINAQTTINSAGFLEVLGTGYTFEVPTSSAYFRYNPPYNMAAGGSVNFVQGTPLAGVFVATVGLQCSAGPQLSGFARGVLTVPRTVPVLGGWVFGSAQASFNNSGFRGSVTANISPAIPSVCTPAFCLPGGCVHWWCPKWNNPRRTCKRCWSGPCFSATCTPRIPAVSATLGFKFEGGSFTFNRPFEDPMVEDWEVSVQQPLVDEATGNRMSFMYNWSRLDKWTTGKHGHDIATETPPQLFPDDPPPLPFVVPAGEESIMFRLTWENPENGLVFMTARYSDYPTLNCVSDEVWVGFSMLRPIDSWAPGAYCIIDGQRREAIIGIPHPEPGTWTVEIQHTNNLGNYAVELLRQNPTPVVAVDWVNRTESPIEYGVSFTTIVGAAPPTNCVTRFLLAQTAADPTDPLKRVKAGPVYVADSFPTVNGTHLRYFHTPALHVPPGEYTLIVSVEAPTTLEVEAFSQQKVIILAGAAPEPVPSFATRGEVGGFAIQWQPSPSPDVDQYVVRYTQGTLPSEFEAQQSFAANENQGTIRGLVNGRPYLVTILAMSTNGLPSAHAEVQRVIPTEGYGLNAPFIVSTPSRVATASYQYTYFPEAYDADDSLRPPGPVPDGETDVSPDEPQDGHGRQWTLVAAPAGMTIEPSGRILWTPTHEQVGDHEVTIRVTDLASLPPRQDTNSLIGPQSGEQTFTLTVVGADQPPQFTRNHYRFLTSPNDTAYAGEVYRYVPFILAPTNRFALFVDDGPPDLVVIQEGSEPNITNVVVRAVPGDATGHRVVLRAVPDLGPNTTPDDTVIQEFFLSVSSPERHLPQPVQITAVTQMAEGIGLRWVGSTTNYQVQRATDLRESPAGPALQLDFNGALPSGVAIYGPAFLANGALEFNPDLNSQESALLINDFASGQLVHGFEANFRMKITATTSPPADGFSFNWATDLPNGSWPLTEEGIGSGLTVSFDTYDNAGGEAPAIDVKWNQVTVAHLNVPLSLFLNNGEPADVRIKLHPDATLDVSYAGQVIYSRLVVPGLVPLSGARFAMGARTGGLRELHSLDDLTLQLTLGGGGTVWENITTPFPGAAVNFHVDTNPPPARAFYRISGTP